MELHRIDVEILDINDNAPYFSKKEYNFQVIESASPGARYSLESASDPDVAMNTIQTYKLNPSDNFKLNVVSLPDGTKYIEMVLHTSLDREKQEEYKLTLTAFDGGNPQKSGSVKINVIVLDANDNAPVFSQSVYRVTVPENAPKGAVILRVSASDNDKGTNEEITFSFSQHTSSASSLFIIDPHSGEISVTGVLDYEKAKHYEINIEATDKGGLTDTSKVLIETNVSEKATPGTEILHVKAMDADEGVNGEIEYFFAERTSDLILSLFAIESSTGTIVVRGNLDHETNSLHRFDITAKDKGNPQMDGHCGIEIKILDINDNNPEIIVTSLTSPVPEDSAVGTVIALISAKDPDSGDNGKVLLTLSPKSPFKLNPSLNGMPINYTSSTEFR
uniref:Cadherin domain-containing protein n=1 Tax=Haplochromis burtoni TaxID=8153 RepID=A0A3Q2WPX7_HAPBU